MRGLYFLSVFIFFAGFYYYRIIARTCIRKSFLINKFILLVLYIIFVLYLSYQNETIIYYETKNIYICNFSYYYNYCKWFIFNWIFFITFV